MKISKRIISFAVAALMLLGTVPAISAESDVGGTAVEPYQITEGMNCRITEYKNGDEEFESSIRMMGIEYTDGLEIYSGLYGKNGEVLYNLGGEFRVFSFDLGHVDDSGTPNGVFYIYADGTLVDTVNVDSIMQTVHYTLNVSGVNQLRILFDPDNEYTGYGLANIRAYTREEAQELGIIVPVISSSEIIKRTSLSTDGEYIAPYQITEGTNCHITEYKNGDEEFESSFRMMGIEYTDGLKIYSGLFGKNGEFIYNLGEIFDTFSFELGHVDDGGTPGAVLYVYADGTLIKEITCESTMNVSLCTFDVTGVNQLRIVFDPEKEYTTYGLANIRAIHNHEWNSEPTVDKEATCDADGYMSIHCATCGKSNPKTMTLIDATGHIYDYGICVGCGKSESGGNSGNGGTTGSGGSGDGEHIVGDINGDGVINTKDLTRLMKKIAGEGVEAFGGDVTGDGNINTKDLTRLMKYLSGESVELH